MEQSAGKHPRKKFLLWGAALLSSLTVFKFLPRNKKEKKPTVKMLTQDGRLVEIDKSLFVSSGNKINNKELKEWVKK